MTTTKAVIVVGAGASKDFGFPIGDELANEIQHQATAAISKLKGQGHLADTDFALWRFTTSQYETNGSFEVLSHADKVDLMRRLGVIARRLWLAPTIDQFIAENQISNSDIVPVAKHLIVKCLLAAEHKLLTESTDNVTGDFLHPGNWQTFKETWIYHFFRALQVGCKEVDQFIERLRLVKVVNFNYDRCIEFILDKFIEQYWEVSEKAAIQIRKNLEIHHVYGSLGQLQNQDRFLKFGALLDAQTHHEMAGDVAKLHDGIVTMSESENSEAIFRDWFREASTVTFLGFGFAKSNLRKLNLLDRELRKKGIRPSIFCTTLGWNKLMQERVPETLRASLLSDPDRQNHGIVSRKFFSVDGTGADLFKIYSGDILDWEKAT